MGRLGQHAFQASERPGCREQKQAPIVAENELDAIAGKQLQGIARWIRDGNLSFGCHRGEHIPYLSTFIYLKGMVALARMAGNACRCPSDECSQFTALGITENPATIMGL